MKEKIYLERVSLEKARKRYINIFKNLVLEAEKVRVVEACGRVTAREVYARRSAPGFYASAMDGIAVRSQDTAGASERNPIILKAGKDALKVDTGDPVPDGFDAVIKIEEVNEVEFGGNDDGEIFYRIEKAVPPWHNVRSIGESIVRGQLVLPVNHPVRAFDVGALLEAGISEIMVRKRPVIGIIPTGSELVPPRQEPATGQLTEFNSAMLRALALEWGARPQVTEIIRDDFQELKRKFNEVHGLSDITVIIAGSSAGREDYTYRLLQELGEVVVHGINIMPGKPVILAVVEDRPVIGLPGYPLAALLNYHLFVRELVFRMQGLIPQEIKQVNAITKRKIPSPAGLKEFLRVNLAFMKEGFVAVPGKRGSASMESLVKADGIITIPEKKEGLEPGCTVPVFLLKSEKKLKKNLLLCGSHDLTLDILRNKLREKSADFDLSVMATGSLGGLMSLKRGECHLAGSHLLDEKSGKYNLPFIEKFFSGRRMALIKLVYRQQGLMVKKGNPMGIKRIGDLTRKDIRFINRQRGAGTRILLDFLLEKEGIRPECISGYQREEYTHINAAVAVASGSADVTLGIMAAANAFELDFIPLAEERYDLVLPADFVNDDRIGYLIKVIRSDEFKKEVLEMGGYRVDEIGEVIRVT